MLTFESIKNDNFLLYEYIRGSRAYGINRPDSDTDIGGIYMEPYDVLLGLGLDYQEEVKDKHQDKTWFSFRKFMRLLIKSNPTVLEALFIPERCILFEHPIMTELKKHRNLFVTKECFKPFINYSVTQLLKARSLEKKVVSPMSDVKKGILDFMFYRYKQGSRNIKLWLEDNGLYQEYCGLANIDRMKGVYSLYYDWGAHLQRIGITSFKDFCDKLKEGLSSCSPFWLLLNNSSKNPLVKKSWFSKIALNKLEAGNWWYRFKDPLGYRGLTNSEDTTNEARLSSILKGEKSLIDISYNSDGYQAYCKKYREWKEWNKEKNEERFKEVVDHKGYDCKNAGHSIRLMNMGIEIAEGKEVMIDRTEIDADFILSVRNGDVPYGDIKKYLESKEIEMREAMNKSTIKESIDLDKINELMINLRKEFYFK